MSDTRFSSSFIPKSPVVGQSLQKEPMGLFQAVAGFIFLVSVLSVGGIFAYKKVMEGQVDDLKSELAILESQINREEIDKIVSFDRKVNSVKDLLVGHVAVSNFLSMLEANTVLPLSYSSLKYNAPMNENISVQLEGKADNYRVLSEQEKVFLRNPNTISVDFKNLSSDDSRRASFSLDGVFRREVVSSYTSEEDDAVVEVKNEALVATSTNALKSTATSSVSDNN